jgi:hypothetical protein
VGYYKQGRFTQPITSEIMPFAGKWMKLENMLSKISQGEVLHIFSSLWKLGEVKQRNETKS